MRSGLFKGVWRSTWLLLSAAALVATLGSGCAEGSFGEEAPPHSAGGKADEWGSGAPAPFVLPLLKTSWGQAGNYQAHTPRKDGAPTYPGCTTIAAAQILFYYRFQNQANSEVYYHLEHGPLTGPDIVDGGHGLRVNLPQHSYDFSAMGLTLDRASGAQISETAKFIYHVAVTLNNQFGGGSGSSATGKQVENAFRYQWGYNSIARRKMSVITKEAFGYDDAEWIDVVKRELSAGRPVLYMAQQANADVGHAFVIDGYNRADKFHVNWGWGGYGNGDVDLNALEDPSGRRWTRDAMIYRGLEPQEGFAAALLQAGEVNDVSTEYSWT